MVIGFQGNLLDQSGRRRQYLEHRYPSLGPGRRDHVLFMRWPHSNCRTCRRLRSRAQPRSEGVYIIFYFFVPLPRTKATYVAPVAHVADSTTNKPNNAHLRYAATYAAACCGMPQQERRVGDKDRVGVGVAVKFAVVLTAAVIPRHVAACRGISRAVLRKSLIMYIPAQATNRTDRPHPPIVIDYQVLFYV